MGMAFCHALELVPKMHYGASLYLTLQRSLYLLFGAPVGAAIEVAAVIGTIGLIPLVRRRVRNSFRLTIAAAVCMATAHTIWWIWVNPANAAMAHMAIEAPSPGWVKWRDQWEYAHLARFALQLFGFAALLVSVLIETPGET
jgi:hypothetical protein